MTHAASFPAGGEALAPARAPGAWGWRVFLLLAFGLLLATEPVKAQDAPRFTFTVRGVPLDAALRELIATTRLDLSYDPDLVRDKQAYCLAEQAAAEEVLRCLLRGTGLDFYRRSTGLYVLTEAAGAPPLRGDLHGIVVDAASGEPLPDAHVLMADGRRGAVANRTGRFQFAGLEPGYYRVTTSFLGYRPRVDSIWVPPEGTARTRVPLEPDVVLVSPLVISGMAWRPASDSLGSASLQADRLSGASGGRLPDVAFRLGSLVGVRLNDATADLHVQGGESGEHQIRLDGAPVFVPVSIGGLVGPFSPFAIGRVTIHKTGFGAALGSQSAGVIEAEHALDATGRPTAEVQVDPLSVNTRISAGLGRPEGIHASLLLAGRHSVWELYAPSSVRRLLEDWNVPDPFVLAAFPDLRSGAATADVPLFRRTLSNGDPALGFHDLHGALRLRFGALHSLHASGYVSRRTLDSERDIFETLANLESRTDAALPTRDLYSWNNTTAQIRYEAVLDARLLASLRARASLYRLRHDFAVQRALEEMTDALLPEPLGLGDDDDNRIREFGVEARLDAAVRDGWIVEAGIEPIYTLSRFLIQGTQPQPIVHLSSGWRLASFATNRLRLGRRSSLDAGGRLTYLAAQDKVFFEPRLALRYDHPGGVLGPWSMRLATGLYRQFVNQFDVSSRSARALSATSRMWLGVDDSVTPPRAAHVAAEWLLLPADGWTLRLEGYYKRHLHLLAVDYTTGASARAATGAPRGGSLQNDLQDQLAGRTSLPQAAFLAEGKGSTFGVSTLVERRLRRARLEARYEFSRAQRSFPFFYDGASVPAPWNEPHRLELGIDWRPVSRLTLLARWHSIWGRAWGFRQSYYDFLGAYSDLSVLLRDPVAEDILRQVRAYRLAHPREHVLPPVHQLDLSGAYTYRLGGVTVQTRIDLLNVLDHDNVADWRFVLDPATYQDEGLLQRDARLLLPFTPSLAVRVVW